MAERSANTTSGDPAAPPPGVRLGLPATGRGSVAGWRRRFLGVCVDWAVAYLIAGAFLNRDLRATAALGIFALMHVLLVSTIGMTIGHAVTGTVVRRLDARTVGFAAGVARAILLSLVIPAVVTDPDRRGLHDKAARTVVVRR